MAGSWKHIEWMIYNQQLCSESFGLQIMDVIDIDSTDKKADLPTIVKFTTHLLRGKSSSNRYKKNEIYSFSYSLLLEITFVDNRFEEKNQVTWNRMQKIL